MMAGHWALGQDHTFVYRNSGERMAAAQTGVVPDYAAVRPGNFLFHDLKLLEHGPFKKDFPTQVLYEYVRNHYLRQMDLAVLDADGEPGSNATVNQYFIHGGIRYIVPLERNQKHIIPFRALKKHDNDPQYYEYGQECYMAELVDIALQLDAIGQYMGSEESKAVLGDVSIGKHAWDLIFDLYYSAEGSLAMAALAIEQILFMKGRIAAGGRQSIEATLSNRKEGADLLSILATIESVQELTSTGVPQTSRPPLTCYYEWFQKHARPISSEEIRRRGVAVVDSVFK
jgi:hypothetical protein